MRRTRRVTAPARLQRPRAPYRTPRISPPSWFLRLSVRRSAQTPQGPRASCRPKPLPYTELSSSFSPYESAASWWLPEPRRTTGLTLKQLCKQNAGLMFVRRRNSNINRGQKSENVRLNNGHENMKSDKGQRNNCREYSQKNSQDGRLMPSPHRRPHQQSKKDYVEQVAGKNVGPETHSQGKNAGRRADEFDGKQQDAQQPIAQIS